MADIYLSVGPNIAKIKPTEFTSAVQKKINSLSQKSLPKVSVGIEVDKKSINAFKSELVNVIKSLSVDNKGLIKIDIGSLDEASRKIRETSQSIQELQKSTNGKTSFLDGRALEDAQATVQGLINKLSELKDKNSGSKLIPGIDKTISDLNKLKEALSGQDKVPYQDYKNQIDAASTSLKLFREEQKALNREAASAPQTLAQGTDEYNKTLAEAVNLLTQVTDAQKKWTAAQYGKSSGSYNQLDGVAGSLRYIIDNFDKLSKSEILTTLNSAKNSFKNITSDVKGAGEATSVFLSRLKGIPGQLVKLFGMQRIFSEIVRAMKSMITTVIDLDSAMTQLQIVTGATDGEMTRFMANSTQLAKDLGKSISEITSSIEVFSRLGYSLEDASTLTKAATIMSNVAAVSTDEATTGLTAIIKGYQMNVENSEHVADVLVEVGQKYAVSAGELMSAFERSGAALAATNTSFEKSAGLIAAANAAVQNASTVGTALKTVSARIRGSKADLEELGEDTTELAEGFSKYADELKALTRFDIRVDGTTDAYKDIYDIFEGISKVWKNLTDAQQARVAEILGGVRQLQVISSILTNWDDAANAYADAMDSAGTATEANARYMDSIQGHLGQLKASWQELASSTFTRDAITQIVDLGKTIVDGPLTWIGKLIDQFGVLNTTISGLAIYGYIKQFKNFKEAFGSSIEFAHDGCESIAA